MKEKMKDRLCILLVIGLIVGLMFYSGGIEVIAHIFSGENTITTTTTTTTTQTTSPRYTFRAMWDFVPIMDVSGPLWLDVQIHEHETGYYCDGVSMNQENTWFNSINQLALEPSMVYEVSVVTSSEWEFQINFHDFIEVTPGTPMSYTWDLTVGDWQDWGDLSLQWVVI